MGTSYGAYELIPSALASTIYVYHVSIKKNNI